MPEPRVFTIPPGVPFLPSLADALIAGRLLEQWPPRDEPGRWSELTIYVPTRRAARAFAALLAERAGGRALLLPRIIPLGEAEDSEPDLSGGAAMEAAEVLAPPIPLLERRLILTRLVQSWSREVDRDLTRLGPDVPFMVPASPADAVSLAGDLETLMDALATEEIAWDDLADAVEAEYSKYFEITLRFVRIAAENWPGILAERGASDPARRRSALIAAEARRLDRERPPAPIIAAGSTGSIPATAALLAAIANLPNGAVILPGLDTDLDEASWRMIGSAPADAADPVHGHPQAMLRRLLEEHLRMRRSSVRILAPPPDRAAARTRFLSEALRPADSTDRWASMPAAERFVLATAGCEGLALVEAADEREEALAAAIAMRETLAAPGRTAVLVTPDRSLATRVSAELARWGLAVEDSAGIPLADTAAGRLARLAADAAALDFHPVRLLALLAHPDVRLGWPRAEVERAASTLEIGVLRGPQPAPGLDGLRAALVQRRAEAGRLPRPRRRLGAGDWALAAELLRRLEGAFGRFTTAAKGEGERDLVALSREHRRTVEALADGGPDAVGPGAAEGSYEALAALFDDLGVSQTGGIRGRFVDYPPFFAALARQRTVNPPPRATHRRLKILGLLEARLLGADRVVLGGLDEGIWPPRAETDAFLNRPMRSRVGLAPPERRIGQTAHDFVQALGTHDVVITRAAKRGGSPMVPSRFLQRMKAFAGDAVWTRVVARGEYYRLLARALDTPAPAPALPRPAPKPDPALFPRALSVTEIETLVRDPYAIFARRILKLDPLEPVAGAPGAAERGTIIHAILERFVADHPSALPAHALEDLIARGQEAFGPIGDAFPELYAEWWPRFERLARAFIVWEEARRADLERVETECWGELALSLRDGSGFTLRARADRIEWRRDGRFAIVDFKTGSPPGLKEVFAGFAPQLTLEAAMLMRGAFTGLPAAAATPDLVYVHAAGGRNPLSERILAPPRGEARSVAALVDEHFRRLCELLDRYVAGEAAYVSRPFPKYARLSSDYDHLARVKEWSATSAGGFEDGQE